jgi:FkbM family methyltransferase
MRLIGKAVLLLLLSLLPLGVVAHFLFQMESFRVVAASWVLGKNVNERPCAIEPGRKFTIDFHGMTYYGDSSTLIDHAILCYGDFGLTELSFLSDAVQKIGRADPVFVDVGANSGVHSLYMSRFAGTVHAFEPYEPVLDRFEQSLRASAVENVVIHRVGLGEADAELPFQEPPPDNMGLGSFVDGLHDDTEGKGLVLSVKAGDAYFEGQGIERLDVFKIDTEGFEKPILKGLRKTLARTRPVGAFELTHKSGFAPLFRDKQELMDVLPPDYSVFVIEREGESYRLRPFDVDLSTWYDFQAAVAAIPNELAPAFADHVAAPKQQVAANH